jgi:hypothetical protein
MSISNNEHHYIDMMLLLWPVSQTRKNRLTLRGGAGVWDRESGDRIKGCDGTWIHAVGSLAGADGWNITNVAAFPISSVMTGGARPPTRLSPVSALIFNTTCE